MKYLLINIFLVIFILVISYYLTLKNSTKNIESFLPPTETSISNDVELKKYFDYVYSQVNTATDNCEKISVLSDLVPSYLSILQEQTKTINGIRSLKKRFPKILKTDFDIDNLNSLYSAASNLPNRDALNENKNNNKCYIEQVEGATGDMENCINILQYFYSKPKPPTESPTQIPALYGAPPPNIDISSEDDLRKFIETAYIVVTKTQNESGTPYTECTKMNWCSIWIPAALTPIVENYSFNELLLNYPNILSNVYDIDAFYTLVLTSNNLAGVSNKCKSKNANNSLKGAYRDVVKYLKYFFGKPRKVLRPPGGDLIDTQS